MYLYRKKTTSTWVGDSFVIFGIRREEGMGFSKLRLGE